MFVWKDEYKQKEAEDDPFLKKKDKVFRILAQNDSRTKFKNFYYLVTKILYKDLEYISDWDLSEIS